MSEILNKVRHTGKEWSDALGIVIINPTGWHSPQDFESRKITKGEFCNRAALSIVKPMSAASRREAKKMLGKVYETTE